MKIFYLALGLILSCCPTVYAAQEGDTYGGVQYSLVTYDEEGFDDVEPVALVGKFGRFINDSVAVEGRIGIGIQDDEVEVLGFDVDVDVETLFGVYGVFHSDTRKDAVFYGVIGITRGELELSFFGFEESGDESGLSYGFGANFGHFNIEYMSYLDEDDFEATAIGIGYISSFD